MADHEGISRYRIKTNPLEMLFARKWDEIAPSTLGYLIDGQNRMTHNYTKRDAQVAATIIQWLGSPVGESFVRDVLQKFDESR